MDTVYRRLHIEPSAISVLQERKGLLTSPQSIGGKSIQVRNPVSVKLTGKDNSCKKGSASRALPYDLTTWSDTYKTKKPYPTLKSINLEYGGDWGMAQRLTATIECYTIDSVETVKNAFLLPGNDISLDIYRSSGKNVWNGVSQKQISIKGFKTAVFAFNATQEGVWVCTFTAVSSATALKNLDMGLMLDFKSSLGYITFASTLYDTQQIGKVKSISELIAYDAQKNGKFTLDQLEDGCVLSKFDGYNPTGNIWNRECALVTYKGKYLQTAGGRGFDWTSWLTSAKKDSGEQVNTQIYVTLGYIVNRIINDQLKNTVLNGMCDQDAKEFENVIIQFDPVFSKTIIPSNLRSGNPLSVLILGSGRGDYKPKGSFELKNFEDIKSGNLSDISAYVGGDKVDLSKILIHADVVTTSLATATKKREANADNSDAKDTKEEVISIQDFFKSISDVVNDATGGAISLRLVEDVMSETKKDLIVVDQNFGGYGNDLQCWVFDPIGGDGSTRTCDLTSNVGSDEYRASLFAGMSKKGDMASAMRGCDDNVKLRRQVVFDKAWKEFYTLVYEPGMLAKNMFNTTEIDGCKTAIAAMFKNRGDADVHETLHWPGVVMRITLDGTWGFIPGNGMMSTQMPGDWKAQKLYFMITRVSHTISDSDWVTEMEGMMSHYKNIKYLPSAKDSNKTEKPNRK